VPLSIQSDVPAITGVVSPVKVRNDEPLVLIVTSEAAGGLNVEAPLAVNEPLVVVAPVTVKAPLFVVVMAEVLEVPILTAPLPLRPVPPRIETFPPFLVPLKAVALPPWIKTAPPVAPPFDDSSPPLIVKVAPVPPAVLLDPGWKTRAVGEAPEAVVISGFWPPARVSLPAVEILRLEPITWNVPVVFPIVVLFPAPEAKVVTPVEVKAVNVPAAAVVAPIAVELIPVEVVVK
jgi:hypothetical protein